MNFYSRIVIRGAYLKKSFRITGIVLFFRLDVNRNKRVVGTVNDIFWQLQ